MDVSRKVFEKIRRGHNAICARQTGLDCAEQRHQGWQRLPRPLLRGPRADDGGDGPPALSRFNYLTVKADRPRRAAGGALRLVRRVRSGRTRRQRAAGRLPRNAPDSAAPQRHIAHHATLKFRNRRLSRVQLAMTI